MLILSKKLELVKHSATTGMASKVLELKKKGVNVIGLELGEPDFDTPSNIKAAAIKAINQGKTKYTQPGGMIELKEAVCRKLERENKLKYQLDEIIIGAGAKHVLYNLFTATINQNDEVIIPIPYWGSYRDIVLLSQGKPVFILTDNNFKLTAQQLSNAITSKTKWFILNSPNNPTGIIYNTEELKSLAEVLNKNRHVNIVCDDIYEHIIFNNSSFQTFVNVAPFLKDRIFIVNGVSKAYAMTGWRIGYGAGNRNIIKAMTSIQSQSTSNPCSISQVAAIEALNGPQDYIKVNKTIMKERRDIVFSMLSKLNGITCIKPEATFFMFVNCKGLFGKKNKAGHTIKSSQDIVDYLLYDANVALVAGNFFGIEGYFRISYAISKELLIEACSKIRDSLSKLS